VFDSLDHVLLLQRLKNLGVRVWGGGKGGSRLLGFPTTCLIVNYVVISYQNGIQLMEEYHREVL